MYVYLHFFNSYIISPRYIILEHCSKVWGCNPTAFHIFEIIWNFANFFLIPTCIYVLFCVTFFFKKKKMRCYHCITQRGQNKKKLHFFIKNYIAIWSIFCILLPKTEYFFCILSQSLPHSLPNPTINKN